MTVEDGHGQWKVDRKFTILRPSPAGPETRTGQMEVELLAELGELGWELITETVLLRSGPWTTAGVPIGDFPIETVWTFKRPVGD